MADRYLCAVVLRTGGQVQVLFEGDPAMMQQLIRHKVTYHENGGFTFPGAINELGNPVFAGIEDPSQIIAYVISPVVDRKVAVPASWPAS